MTSTAPDPAALAALERARDLEPAMRLAERSAALDLAEQLAAGDAATVAEVAAERAIDTARMNEIDAATVAARAVLADPAAGPVARARATEAWGRALAWTGTASATRRANRLLAEAVEAYDELGAKEWAGYATFWRANTVHLQNGEMRPAIALMDAALERLGPDSPRRATVLTYYADALTAVGEAVAAATALDEAAELADRDDDAKTRAYVAWSQARLASSSMDATATERHLREAERDRGDWFDMHSGVTFLADAAELLDRVGLVEQAHRNLRRAQERDPDDEFVRQARATLLARGDDPVEALDALQELVRGDWLEKRQRWRHVLLSAWATFRAGRDGAGTLAARALELAEASGGVQVALAGEPELTRALLPLAAAVGSVPARVLLAGADGLLLHLFGAARAQLADGTEVPLPAGQPAELVRMLGTYPRGRSVEEVCDALFPDTDIDVARRRLRQVLNRLRPTGTELVLRQGNRLVLRPAWVDVREFATAADRVRAAGGPRAAQLAYEALALWSGPLLPDDAYAEWAAPVRTQMEHRHLTLLDLVIADAERRGSHQEAVTAMTAALEHVPYDRDRYYSLAEHLLSLGRHATAHHLARLAGVDLDDP